MSRKFYLKWISPLPQEEIVWTKILLSNLSRKLDLRRKKTIHLRFSIRKKQSKWKEYILYKGHLAFLSRRKVQRNSVIGSSSPPTMASDGWYQDRNLSNHWEKAAWQTRGTIEYIGENIEKQIYRGMHSFFQSHSPSPSLSKLAKKRDLSETTDYNTDFH